MSTEHTRLPRRSPLAAGSLRQLAAGAAGLSAALLVGCADSDTAPASADAAADTYWQLAADANGWTQPVAELPPVKLDILWVVGVGLQDAGLQRALPDAAQALLKQLQSAGRFDIQTATVGASQLPDRDPATAVVERAGQFLHTTATRLPSIWREATPHVCLSDADCTAPFDTSTEPGAVVGALCGALVQSQLPLAGSAADWTCATTSESEACSAQSSCRFTCASDGECQQKYGPRAVCAQPGGGAPVKGSGSSSAGCMVLPDTGHCPSNDALPQVLHLSQPLAANAQDPQAAAKTEADWFGCSLFAGSAGSPESDFDGGLRAAWVGLDPSGPECPSSGQPATAANCQNKALLRDDAWLLIVVVDADDDCSVPAGIALPYQTAAEVSATLTQFPVDFWSQCAVAGDASGSNSWLNEATCQGQKLDGKVERCPDDCRKLAAGSAERGECETEAAATLAAIAPKSPRVAPVQEFLASYKTLKNDPRMVLFAAVGGDSMATDPDPAAQAQKRHDARVTSYPVVWGGNPLSPPNVICSSKLGAFRFGSRYLAAAESMGEQGLFLNACEADDLLPAAAKLATLAIDQTMHICLPLVPEMEGGKPALQVTRLRGGTETTLQWQSAAAGQPDGWVLREQPDCWLASAPATQKCATSAECPAATACHAGKCRAFGPAVTFTTAPEQADSYRIELQQ